LNAENYNRIWVVDRLDHWRDLAVSTLEQAGFAVEAFGRYDELPSGNDVQQQPDLVVLGCARSYPEERQLVEELTHRGLAVLILGSCLSATDFRSFFLAGATDVSPRPNTPDYLLSLVQTGLIAITRLREQPQAWREATL
jgi:DNA-binding NtrC family response regulator